jgi:LacI family kdg operon repressor
MMTAPFTLSSRTTIADVARRAGVSKATVSRFLNHREKLLTPDIAARVEVAIAELGYVPSTMAQALKLGRSRLIGMVVADVTNPYSVAVLRGAEKACKEAGYLVVLFNLGNEPEREREAIATLSSYQVDGFILNTFGRYPPATEVAARQGKPAVLIDRRHRGMDADFVSLDNAEAVRMAVDHLADAGYRNLLFITEPLANVSSRLERESAFRISVAGHPAKLSGATLESIDGDSADLESALVRWRESTSGGLPAILSGNAVVTLRVATAISRLHWRFGAEIGLLGFDEADWAPLIGSGISTIGQPTDDLGRLAARCLIERLEGATTAPRQILLAGNLTVRGSSRATP